MSRWKVFRYESETGWTWAAGEIGDPWRSCDFHTWREALAYADRMARTREVVLPRNHDLKKSVHKDINGDLYANYGSANYWAQDNWNKGPKPLALALLALAEQEVSA